MFWSDLTLALLVALAFGCGVLVWAGKGGAGMRGWPAAIVVFCVIFLMTWAGGIWLSPLGPRLWGTAWVPFVFVGIVSALLLASLTSQSRVSDHSIEQAEAREFVLTTANVFFWVLIAVLVAAVVLHYAGIVERREPISTYSDFESPKGPAHTAIARGFPDTLREQPFHIRTEA